jgi:hypothetical protein
MQINWSALGMVFLVSLAATILLTVLFAISLTALGKGRRAVAIGGFSLCGVVMLFGIAVILA